MANRDHSLEDGIVQAAYSEFLTYGFQKASLHKIADKAGVTTGAIYTRYKNKDALFGSLLQDFLIRLFGMPFLQKKCIPHGDALILTEMLSLTSPLT